MFRLNWAWSHKRGVQKPAQIPAAINTTLAFIRGEQGREVAGLRFVHNESSMCVFVCVWVSECLINKALGWPWYPAARLAVIETDFIMNFKHRSNLLHQITERNPPLSLFYSFAVALPPRTCLWWFGEPGKDGEKCGVEKKNQERRRKSERKKSVVGI